MPLLQTLMEQGRAALARGDRQLALECFTRIVERDPHNVAALNNRGLLLGFLGQIEPALGCFQQALQIDQLTATILELAGEFETAAERHSGDPGQAREIGCAPADRASEQISVERDAQAALDRAVGRRQPEARQHQLGTAFRLRRQTQRSVEPKSAIGAVKRRLRLAEISDLAREPQPIDACPAGRDVIPGDLALEPQVIEHALGIDAGRYCAREFHAAA